MQRSHPARQAGSAPKHPEEGAREVFISLNPSWRKGCCCQSLSLPPPSLAAIPLRVPGAEGARGGVRRWRGRGSSPQPLGRQIGQAQVMRGGTKPNASSPPSIPPLPDMADDNKPREKGVRRRDEPWVLCRGEASGCSEGEVAGEKTGGLGARHPLPTCAPEAAGGGSVSDREI